MWITFVILRLLKLDSNALKCELVSREIHEKYNNNILKYFLNIEVGNLTNFIDLILYFKY